MQRQIWDRIMRGLTMRGCGPVVRECGTGFDSQNDSPYKQPGERHQGQPGSNPGSTQLDLALQVQDQLPTAEEVLGGQSTPQPQADPDELHGIQPKIENAQQQVGQTIEFRHPRRDCTPETLSSLEGVNRSVDNHCGRHPSCRAY